MNHADALPYVTYAVDNALSQRDPKDAPPNAVLVGWEPHPGEFTFVAVWSYLMDTQGHHSTLDADEAADLAKDLLQEVWATTLPAPDYVIVAEQS